MISEINLAMTFYIIYNLFYLRFFISLYSVTVNFKTDTS